MATFYQLITFEYENEHDLSQQKNFSVPKIYTVNSKVN